MFFEELTPEPEQLHIVCGDFNIDHSSKNIKLTKLKDIFSFYNLSNTSNVGFTTFMLWIVILHLKSSKRLSLRKLTILFHCKKSKPSQQPNWIDISIKNRAANKTELIPDLFEKQKFKKNKEKVNKIRNKLRKKIKENKRIYYQKMLHKNAKNNSISFFNTMKTLSGNTRKEQEELSEKQIEGFNIYFTTIIEEKMVFKIRDRLGRLMSHFYAFDCDLAFEKFQEAIIEEVDNFIPLKKSKPSQQPNWIDISIKNLAANKTELIPDLLEKQKYKKTRKNSIKSGIS